LLDSLLQEILKMMLRRVQRCAALCPRFSDVMNGRLGDVTSGHSSTFISVRHVGHRSRTVRPVLQEIDRRRKTVELNNKLKEVNPIDRRSSFLEWNFPAELFAFSARLGENIPQQLLAEAFMTDGHLEAEKEKQKKLNIEINENLKSNTELSVQGAELLEKVVVGWLRGALPALPEEGVQAVSSSLLSEDSLADVSFHIGTKDLILAVEYPPLKEDYVKCLKAVVGAISFGSPERAVKFVQDIVISQLVGKDINELWEISNPMKVLTIVLQNEGREAPDARLLWQSGPKTMLANFVVGVYSQKQLIGECSGETLETAEEMAARDALRQLFRTGLDMAPLPVHMTFSQSKQNHNIQDWRSDNIPNLIYG